MTEKKKIFVVGSSRSGTTMMGRVLGKHPDVFTFHELHFFEKMCALEQVEDEISETKAQELFDRLIGMQRVGLFLYPKESWGKFEEEAARLVQSCSRPLCPAKVYEHYVLYEAALNGAVHACDQTPRNVLFIDELLELYPDAYFAIMTRDPRAVMASQKKKWKRRYLVGGGRDIPLRESLRARFNYHPIMMGFLWRAAARKGISAQGHPRVQLVRFEDFTTSPEVELRKICETIGIRYLPEMLDIPHVGSSHAKDESGALGIRKGVSENWREKSGVTKGEIYVNQLVTGKTAQTLGYQMDAFGIPPISALFRIALFPFSAFVAFLANLGQAQNLLAAIKRRLSIN
jgi:hypothetical protein